jgi:hypothetical protein
MVARSEGMALSSYQSGEKGASDGYRAQDGEELNRYAEDLADHSSRPRSLQ